jgi:hypothetical protein
MYRLVVDVDLLSQHCLFLARTCPVLHISLFALPSAALNNPKDLIVIALFAVQLQQLKLPLILLLSLREALSARPNL